MASDTTQNQPDGNDVDSHDVDSPDALTLLRRSIADNSLPIPTTSANPTSTADSNVTLAQADFLIFNFTSPQQGSQHIPLPLSQPTRFVSAAKGPVDLRSVFFCWTKRDANVTEYLAAVQQFADELQHAGKPGVTSLIALEKHDLVSWLAGDLGEEDSEYIRSLDDTPRARRDAAHAAQTAEGGSDVEMRDAGPGGGDGKREELRLRAIVRAERRMGDRNTALRGSKAQDFSGVRKHSAAFLTKLARGAGPATGVAAAGPLMAGPSLRPAPGKSASRRAEPIIILSPSASSLLRLPNIKSFLVDGVWTDASAAEAMAPGASMLHVARTMPSISSHPLRFILVDSPEHFRPDYWARVVAVFTTGQTWQFKNYKWQAPAELFAHALGVYVGWHGEVVPPAVQGWGRQVLRLAIDKGSNRWRDREVVEDVWRGIEARMRAMGWGREGRLAR